MATVERILAEVEKLPPDQFVRLRRKLDRLEQKLWESESKKAAAKLKAAGVNDKDIDRIVMRRRRESRR
jgi:hypothetical protein